MYTGKCHCGNARYQYTGHPITCYLCHCKKCQRSSGSAFSQNLLVLTEDIQLLSGKLQTKIYPDNKRQLKIHFCEVCVTLLWVNYADEDKYRSLQTGTLDTCHFEPIAQLWVSSATPWVQTDPSIPSFEQQPELDTLIELWNNRQ